MHSSSWILRPLAALMTAALVLGSPAPPTSAAVSAPTQSAPSTAARPAASGKPFAMSLYRKGDYVRQYTFEWCVGASLQMMLNMTTDRSRTSRKSQRRLWEKARDASFSPYGGANPRGWTAVLNDLGVGPYQLVSIPTFDEALTVAAEHIRATRRPVGLVMWEGRHAWVMSGFRSTRNPRNSDAFRVTGIRVLDPLYPYGSSTWGPSPKPHQMLSRRALARQFVFRDGSHQDLDVPPGFLIVLPVD